MAGYRSLDPAPRLNQAAPRRDLDLNVLSGITRFCPREPPTQLAVKIAALNTRLQPKDGDEDQERELCNRERQ